MGTTLAGWLSGELNSLHRDAETGEGAGADTRDTPLLGIAHTGCLSTHRSHASCRKLPSLPGYLISRRPKREQRVGPKQGIYNFECLECGQVKTEVGGT